MSQKSSQNCHTNCADECHNLAMTFNFSGMDNSTTPLRVISVITVGFGMLVTAKAIDEAVFTRSADISNKQKLKTIGTIIGGGASTWLGTLCLNNSLTRF
jgi:hypothetical protein